MGVPITFLNKYNPDQFKNVGADFEVKEGLLPNIIKKNWTGKFDRAYLNGKRMYARLLIKRLTKKQMKIAKVAPPRNKITKADFDILNKKTKKRKKK